MAIKIERATLVCENEEAEVLQSLVLFVTAKEDVMTEYGWLRSISSVHQSVIQDEAFRPLSMIRSLKELCYDLAGSCPRSHQAYHTYVSGISPPLSVVQHGPANSTGPGVFDAFFKSSIIATQTPETSSSINPAVFGDRTGHQVVSFISSSASTALFSAWKFYIYQPPDAKGMPRFSFLL